MDEIDYFRVDETIPDDSVLVLIIYDIESNKTRNSLAKFLQRYGFRVQKSAFEAIIKQKMYNRLIDEIKVYSSDVDSIRIYKIKGKSEIVTFGKNVSQKLESVIVI